MSLTSSAAVTTIVFSRLKEFPMIIRQAEQTDALAIATIHVRSWQHAYRDLLPADQLAALSIPDRELQWHSQLAATSPQHTSVAEIDNAVVGFVSWGIIPESKPVTAMLYSIYMIPIAMGQGTGSALLGETEQGMIAGGAAIGTLNVLIKNTPTRAFYERHGWLLQSGSEQTEHFFGIDVRTVAYRKVFIQG